LWPPEAEAVVGEVQEQTEPAMTMLQAEGFRRCGLVDIFEGGPVVKCALNEIRSIRQSVVAPVAQITEAPIQGESYIISADRQYFRSCQGTLQMTDEGGVRIAIGHAMALRLRIGDPVRFVAAKPAAVKEEIADGSEVSLY
jgi:arginine N-succinyltransferase